MVVFNKKEGIFADVNARQAVLACLDMDEAMKAAFGNPEFYRVDPSCAYVEQTGMYSTAGGELYNQKNPEKAKELLEKTSYNGEKLIWLTTREYPYMYKLAVVAQQQMEAAGFNVELQVVDYATIVSTRNDPSAYDMFSGACVFQADPALMSHLESGWAGWWVNDEKDEALKALNQESDPVKRQQMWGDFQEKYVYGEAPFIKFGDYFLLSSRSTKLKGYVPAPFSSYWNCYLEE